MTQQIVINACHGEFSLSEKAYEALGEEWGGYGGLEHIERDDPKLIQVVKELGSEQASGRYSRLKIVTIPSDVDWFIDEDGEQSGSLKDTGLGVEK